MIILKFIGLLVAAVGSALALFGEPRRDGHLTKLGRAALALVVVGFVVAAVLEVVTAGSQAVEKRLSTEWQDTAEQHLLEIGFTVLLQDEMPLAQFVDHVGEVEVSLGTFVGSRDGNAIVRTLSIKDLRLDSNPERSVVMTSYSRENELVGHGLGVNLKKLTLVDPMGRRGRFWSSSIDDDWTDLNAKAIGLEADIPWVKVGLPSEIATFGAISQIKSIGIALPSAFNMDTVARMDLSIVTSDWQVFFLDLKNLAFHKVEARQVANIEGFELLTRFRDEFRRRGGRGPVGIVFQ